MNSGWLPRGRCLYLCLCQGLLLLCLLLPGVSGCGGGAADRGGDGEILLPIAGERTWRIPSADRFLPAPRGLYSDERDDVYVLDDAGRVLVLSLIQLLRFRRIERGCSRCAAHHSTKNHLM